MLSLRKIDLCNFGLFRNLHSIEVSTAKTKPITLIGGHNGAGKTTILEAVMLALYGRRMFGKPMTAAKYGEYLQQRLHVDCEGVVASSAHVEVEFFVDELAGRHTYRIRRHWRRRRNSQVAGDQVEVWRGDELLTDLHEDKWNEFVEELIPLGIARLVFFDGEKVKSLAEDESHSAELRSSMRSLLGLDRVERLAADLQVYIAQRSEGKTDTLSDRLAVANQQLEQAKTNHGASQERIDDLTERLADVARRIEEADGKLRRAGASHAGERAELTQRKASLKEEHARLVDQFRGGLARFLPFSYLTSMADGIDSLLAGAEQVERSETLVALAADLSAETATRIAEAGRWNDAGLRVDRTHELVQDALGVLSREISPEKRPRIGLNAHERWVVTNAVAEGRREGSEVSDLAARLEAIVSEQVDVERRLKVVPSDETLAPLVTRLNELHQELGALEAEHERALVDLGRTTYEVTEAERQQTKVTEAITKSSGQGSRVRLAGDVGKVLDRFAGDYERRQVEALSSVFVDTFNRLVRKKKFVDSARIDPETYHVTMLRPDGSELPRDRMSAGEKQIFAIALLWSLLQVSGRKLPLIIDTPMGRLDSIHRDRLCTTYFPKASHQVILLSTDTEVDEGLAERLERHVGRLQYLEYDHILRHTEVVDGYFTEAVYAH